MKQQSPLPQSPFDQPKQGVYPSQLWMVWISSVLFFFPGVIPSFLALFLILLIVMLPRFVVRLCFVAGFRFTFVAGIFSSFLLFAASSFLPSSACYSAPKVSTLKPRD
jgi:hypothetical protein